MEVNQKCMYFLCRIIPTKFSRPLFQLFPQRTLVYIIYSQFDEYCVTIQLAIFRSHISLFCWLNKLRSKSKFDLFLLVRLTHQKAADRKNLFTIKFEVTSHIFFLQKWFKFVKSERHKGQMCASYPASGLLVSHSWVVSPVK